MTRTENFFRTLWLYTHIPGLLCALLFGGLFGAKLGWLAALVGVLIVGPAVSLLIGVLISGKRGTWRSYAGLVTQRTYLAEALRSGAMDLGDAYEIMREVAGPQWAYFNYRDELYRAARDYADARHEQIMADIARRYGTPAMD